VDWGVASRSLYFLAGAVVVLALVAAAYYLAAQGGGQPTAATTPTGATTTSTTTHTAATSTPGASTATAATTTAEQAASTTRSQPRELLVYVYGDFMAWGEDEKLFDKLVENFTRETGIRVRLRKFDDARVMITTAIAEAQAGKRTADVIIGVDQVTVHELRKAGLLACYASSLADRGLVEALDPRGCVTPIDYGLIALVYDPGRLNETSLAMLRDGVTLDELEKLAPLIVGEDPARSTPGLNFLLYTIALSEKQGIDWRQLWKNLVARGFMVAKSWGDAYDEFLSEKSRHPIVVSYGTDPAYSAWYNMKHGKPMKPDINATVLALDGKKIGWLQVEGAAILKGAPTEEARRFVDWLLSPRVQSLIPGNQWMLPANPSVELPPYYRYALTAKDVDEIANNWLPADRIAAELEKWLHDWLQAVQQG
jgi:thiamine transport system substrate-binding protein